MDNNEYNNVLHLENNHFGSWFSLTTFSINDCSDRHFQETYSPILHQLWFVPLATKLMEHIRGTLHWVVNNNWLVVSIPLKNTSRIDHHPNYWGSDENHVPNHQPDYVLSCALDPPWKPTGGYLNLKNGPPQNGFPVKQKIANFGCFWGTSVLGNLLISFVIYCNVVKQK